MFALPAIPFWVWCVLFAVLYFFIAKGNSGDDVHGDVEIGDAEFR